MNDQQLGNGPVMDVLPPGSTPAAPSGRPVVTGSSPAAMDPMMTGAPSDGSFMPSADAPLPVDPTMGNGQDAPIQSNVGAAGMPGAAPQDQGKYAAMNAPARGAFADQAANPLISGDASMHSFAQGQAMFGQVGSHRKGRKIFLIVVFVLAILGGAGYFGYMQYKKQDDAATKTSRAPAVVTPATESTKKDTTFTTKLGNYSLDNKYEWKTTENDTTAESGDVAQENKKQYGTVSFAINDTQRLIIDANIGGRGGDCLPATTDVAFAAGNACSSYKALSATKLSAANIPAATLSTGTKAVYLVKYQIRDPQDGDTTLTMVGLTATTANSDGSEKPLELNKEYMGAYFAQSSFDTLDVNYLFKIVDTNNKATQLNDADLAKVSEVLKTFKLN